MFLTSLSDRWLELQRLADLRVRFIDDTGAVFDVMPHQAETNTARTPLMREIRTHGLVL